MRALVFLIPLLLLFQTGSAFAKRGDVNLINCSIFDSKGKLLKLYRGWLCAFFPNGKMLLGDGFTLTFYDEKMNIEWSRDVHVHGSIAYSEADDTALLMVSHVLPNGKRSDRLEVYDKNGRLVKHFNFTSQHAIGNGNFGYDRFMLPTRVTEEVTHVGSFYRIGKNRSKLPHLKEGNYIVGDSFGRIYFFDAGLKKILHSINFFILNFGSMADVQVAESGNLLVYRNENPVPNGLPFSSLEELDPETGKSVWHYEASPRESFYSPYEGNVQALPNGNLLYSAVVNERKGSERAHIPDHVLEEWMLIQGSHQSIEITRDGRVVWRMITKDVDLSGKPNVVKRQNLASYLRHKKRY